MPQREKSSKMKLIEDKVKRLKNELKTSISAMKDWFFIIIHTVDIKSSRSQIFNLSNKLMMIIDIIYW